MLLCFSCADQPDHPLQQVAQAVLVQPQVPPAPVLWGLLPPVYVAQLDDFEPMEEDQPPSPHYPDPGRNNAMDQDQAAEEQAVEPPQEDEDPELALNVGANPPGGPDLVRIFPAEGEGTFWLMGMRQSKEPLGEWTHTFWGTWFQTLARSAHEICVCSPGDFKSRISYHPSFALAEDVLLASLSCLRGVTTSICTVEPPRDEVSGYLKHISLIPQRLYLISAMQQCKGCQVSANQSLVGVGLITDCRTPYFNLRKAASCAEKSLLVLEPHHGLTHHLCEVKCVERMRKYFSEALSCSS